MSGAEVFFGGSFDPVHLGHLFAAQEAATAVGASRVLVVPTARNPLKQERSAVSVEHRLEMVRRAVADNDMFVVSEVEIAAASGTSGEPSYTEATVRTLIETGMLVSRPAMIIGDDLLAELPRWKNYQALLSAVRLIVVSRYGVDRSTLPADAASDTLILENPEIPVSSSTVRSRLRQGRSVRYLVPDAVYEYINTHQLYQ
ncbi:MAG: nicotinate (nicotinamide) nucleotide adenylyltransferase [Alkalispirochaeta sp.]